MTEDDAECDAEAVDYMVDWFLARYEDPVHSQPWDEGEYVWLVPSYDAREELEERFPKAPAYRIERAVARCEEEGGPEWVKVADLKDFEK